MTTEPIEATPTVTEAAELLSTTDALLTKLEGMVRVGAVLADDSAALIYSTAGMSYGVARGVIPMFTPAYVMLSTLDKLEGALDRALIDHGKRVAERQAEAEKEPEA